MFSVIRYVLRLKELYDNYIEMCRIYYYVSILSNLKYLKIDDDDELFIKLLKLLEFSYFE
jgi:hypothetical protein